MRRSLGLASALVFSAVVVLVSPFGCTDPPTEAELDEEDVPLVTGVVISNAMPQRAASLNARTTGVSFQSEANEDAGVVYVSLASGTYPTAWRAVIKSPRAPGVITSPIIDGGLDPVPVPAIAGDTLDLEVLDIHGVVLAREKNPVAPRRKPRVVRTVPPRGKTDVAVNSSIIVVFSEPVSASTVTSTSIAVIRDADQISGTARLLSGSGTVAAFTPNAALAPNTTYRLLVTDDITDLDGETLESRVLLSFTTGTASIGTPQYIRLSPDTAFLGLSPLQLTATVYDAAGNELIDQPVAWESSDPSGLTVSPTGLATPTQPGNYAILAYVGDVVGFSTLFVRGPPASLQIVPATIAVPVDEDIAISAEVRDRGGFVLNVRVTWATEFPDVARLTSSPAGAMVATVTGLTTGSSMVTATAGPARGTTQVTVMPRRAVASVRVTPSSASILVGAATRFFAAVHDSNGQPIAGRRITWTTSDSRVATVDAMGVVTGVSAGTSLVTATVEGVSGSATIAPITLRFVSLSATYGNTCGVTTDGDAYCWGRELSGFQGSSIPVRVPGGIKFTSVTAGMTHFCGLTSSGVAYCWGSGDAGQLGDGSGAHHESPVRVSGDHVFTALTAGGPHTCGIAQGGAAYCWGSNTWGQLGDGSSIPLPAPFTRRVVPTPVTGGQTFVALSAGKSDHTCGITTSGDGYCWGRGDFGKLGDGSTTSRNAPVRVSFAGVFSAMAPGYGHSCGLDANGDAYCWGGAGLAFGMTPSPITGHRFTALASGSAHVCGLDATGQLWCWGFNDEGRLGDGSTSFRGSPSPVAGSLVFSSVTAGGSHTCALTTTGIGYCWGWNAEGQLGNGSTANSSVPVKIFGQP